MNIRQPASLRSLRGLLLGLACFGPLADTAAATDQLFVVRNHATTFEPAAAQPARFLDIVRAPTHGALTVNADGTLTFQPSRDICETRDHFSYRIEHDGQRETVEVQVDILCESLTVISNFSPDGDGQNDTFTVLGIQNYPGNQLSVFDAAGLPVFTATDYDNTWAGTDANDQPLEAAGAVYYYVLQDGAGNTYSGLVTIE